MSVLSDSVWPYRWQPTRLPRPWDSPGKNTGVGCHFLLQCMKVKSESEVAQSCPTQWPHGLKPTRLLHPWDFPGKSTGVVCHCLLWPISICLFKYRSWFCVFNTIIVTSIALKISQELPCPKLQISNQVPSLANGHQLRNISGLRSALPLSFLSHIKLPFSWSIPCLYLLLSCVDLSLLPPIHGQLKLGPSFWVWPVSPLELCFWWLSPGLHTLHPVD